MVKTKRYLGGGEQGALCSLRQNLECSVFSLDEDEGFSLRKSHYWKPCSTWKVLQLQCHLLCSGVTEQWHQDRWELCSAEVHLDPAILKGNPLFKPDVHLGLNSKEQQEARKPRDNVSHPQVADGMVRSHGERRLDTDTLRS